MVGNQPLVLYTLINVMHYIYKSIPTFTLKEFSMRITPDHDFQSCDYILRRTDHELDPLPQEASLFSIGNGFIGIRGMKEETGIADGTREKNIVFLNGVYERRSIRYHEAAYGFPRISDVRVPVLDCTGLMFEIDGQDIHSAGWQKIKDGREFDYMMGILFRKIVFEKDTGEALVFNIERFVSMSRRAIVANRIFISADGFSGLLMIHTLIYHPFENVPQREKRVNSDVYDPRVGPVFPGNPWKMETEIHRDNTWTFLYRSISTEIGVATMDRIVPVTDNAVCELTPAIAGGYGQSLTLEISPDKPAELYRLGCYETDRGERDADILKICRREMESAQAAGYQTLRLEQAGELARFSAKAFVDLPDNRTTEGAINFNTVQLLMASGRDGASSASAKGQTGDGYEGHVFWDAEIFVLPFFVYTVPEIARSMLEYRYSMLDYAREIATIMGHSSAALYPWRTISGTECSSYFPAGTAQYHINADIAYAIQQYVEATDDFEFLCGPGIEMLVETARIWPQAGFFNERKGGAFCLNRVTGPDEYTTIVDNNLYTNIMAKGHLEYTLEAIDTIKQQSPTRYTALFQMMNITDNELLLWRKITSNIFLPYSREDGIYLQDEHFLEKEIWDFKNTPADKYPLLLHFHPLTIYRYQVCKQADAVLAMLLKGDEFPYERKAATLKYYESITTHDSTLSPGTFAIVLAECDELEMACQYLEKTTFIDIDNLCNNSNHGLHIAALANSWSSVVFGFGGMRTYNGVLSFNPKYTDSLGPYSFRVNFRGRLIQVIVTSYTVDYKLLEGGSIEFYHGKTASCLKDTLSFAMGHNSQSA